MKITISEAATIAGVTRNAIAYWIASGKIKAEKQHATAQSGPRWVQVIERDDLEKLMEEIMR